MPWITCSKVPVASLPHALVNSSTDMPATSAHFCRPSEFVDTAVSMSVSVLLIAVPPASASMPNEDSAADKPRISACDMPTCVPAAPTRCAMEEIADSVVAVEFPSATRDDA